ncbi:MAG: hypothetical protein AB9872_10085 [Solidesulfovibrio sp.]
MRTSISAFLLFLLLAIPVSAAAASARAAILQEQGVKFAVVHVDYAIVRDKAHAAKIQKLYEAYFKVPVVLMSDDAKRTKWYGRDDIVDFLSDYTFSQIPWEVYELQN